MEGNTDRASAAADAAAEAAAPVHVIALSRELPWAADWQPANKNASQPGPWSELEGTETP